MELSELNYVKEQFPYFISINYEKILKVSTPSDQIKGHSTNI